MVEREFIEHRLFVCDCNSPNHQLILTKVNYTDIGEYEDTYIDTDEMYLSVGILEDTSFFKRLKIAFRYLFGGYEPLVEVILSSEKRKELASLLTQ